VSCYFRQLKDIFAEAGVDVNSSNRKKIDQTIQHIVGTDGKHCPETWAKVKEQIHGDEKKRQEFIAKLKTALK
jgi:hypothetical protein